MAFVKVALMKDLEPGHMIGVEAGGKEIAVVNLEGTVYAIGNRCTHMSCILSDGTLKGGNVTCPVSRFDFRRYNRKRDERTGKET